MPEYIKANDDRLPVAINNGLRLEPDNHQGSVYRDPTSYIEENVFEPVNF